MLALSAVRAKIVAIELGATGVGILGIVTTSVVLASTALGAGLGASAVRAVASSDDADNSRTVVQVAVVRGSAVLGLLAAPLVWVGWSWWGDLIIPDPTAPALAPWVAMSVAAAIGAAGTSALLNGLGRIGALATCTALGSVLGTLVFLAAMAVSEDWGLIAAFAAVPVATVLVGATMAWPTYPRRARVPRRLWAPELSRMILLGLAVSSSVILTNAAQLGSRVWVSHELGIVQAGYLQACLAVGGMYLGFVLNALGAEYYPRISRFGDDKELVNRAANDQMRLVLTLGGPLIVWTVVTAPWLLHLLYDSEFSSGDTLLRLILVGDVFKLVGWCIGYIFLAQEAKLKFFLAEISWNAFFLAVLLPFTHRGTEVVGLAYLTAYVLYTVLSLELARRQTSFVMVPASRRALLWVFSATAATFAAAESGSGLGLAAALSGALVFSVVAASRLLAWTRHDSLDRRLARQ
jgi:PST family polysaccharide transporter